MKFTLPGPKLLRAIETTAAMSPGTGKRHQVEATLLKVFDGGRVEVAATDLHDAAWFHIDGATDAVPGTAFTPSENLLRCVKQAGKDDLTFQWDGKAGRVNVSFGSTSIKLPAEEPSDFPSMLRFEPEKPFVAMPATVLAAMLKRVNFAVMSDFKGRVMAGVYIQVKTKTMRFTATDGIRMATVERDLDKPGTPTSAVISPLAPKALKPIVDDIDTDSIDVQIDPGGLRLRGPRGEFIRRSIVGTFTDYDIEKEVVHPSKVSLDRKELLGLLDSVTALKLTGQTTCEFAFSQQSLSAENRSAIDGDIKSAIKVEWPHAPVSIKLDPDKLCDAVKAAEAEKVEVALGNNQQPILLREEHAGMLYLYALSPRF